MSHAVRVDLVRDRRHVGLDVERVRDAGAAQHRVDGGGRRRATLWDLTLRAAEEEDRDLTRR
jgi:hypothetical protein